MTELPITYRGVVYPWQCDHMGHMNVMWYVGKFDEATWQLLSTVSIGPNYLRDGQRGMVAAEQRIAYKRELLAGDIVTIRSAILEMSEKTIRFAHEMRNDQTREIAAITVLTGVHIDALSRRSVPFPGEILDMGRKMVTQYDPGF